MPSKNFFAWGVPQMKTSTLSKIQGTQAWRMRPASCSAAILAAGSAGILPAVASVGGTLLELAGRIPALRSFRAQISLGRQNFNNTASAAIEHIAPTISTSHGP